MIKTIIHLSDLHIGKLKNSTEISTFKNVICKDIINTYKENRDEIVIAITGDLVDDGENRQYAVLQPEISNLVAEGFYVWPIPGNHDYGPGGIATYDICKKDFEFYILKLSNLKKLIGNDNMTYPQKYIKDNICIIGLNSMEEHIILLQLAQGLLGLDQRRNLRKIIKSVRNENPEAKIIVLLHHYIFNLKKGEKHLRLKDAQELRRILRDDVDIVLHGHEHWHFVMKDQYGIDFIVSCAQSTDPECYESTVKNNKVIYDDKKPEPPGEGFLGWEIQLDSSINIRKMIFTANGIQFGNPK